MLAAVPAAVPAAVQAVAQAAVQAAAPTSVLAVVQAADWYQPWEQQQYLLRQVTGLSIRHV